MKNYGRQLREKRSASLGEVIAAVVVSTAAVAIPCIVHDAYLKYRRNKLTSDNLSDVEVEDEFVDQDLESEEF